MYFVVKSQSRQRRHSGRATDIGYVLLNTYEIWREISKTIHSNHFQ